MPANILIEHDIAEDEDALPGKICQ